MYNANNINISHSQTHILRALIVLKIKKTRIKKVLIVMKHLFLFINIKKMKTLKHIGRHIDRLLTRWAIHYINKVSGALYPKTYLEEYEENDEDNDPILFI